MSCTNDTKKWATNHGFSEPRFCYINMATSQCTSDLMKEMKREIAAALDIDKQSKKLRVFEREFKTKVLVLVLDEIDILFKIYGGVGKKLVQNTC